MQQTSNSIYAPQKPSDSWRNFSYASTGMSLVVVSALIFFSPIDPILKVAFGVSVAWALHNSVSLTKLLRDRQEHEDWVSRHADVPRPRLPEA
jgi:Uncharacterized protein conserved in bacteria